MEKVSHPSFPYSLVCGKLHKLCGDGIIRTCVFLAEAHEILEQLHDEPVGGHFGPLIIVHKILVVGYWWPSLHKDV